MWNAVRTADGSWTLAHPEHKATCHSLAGAWQQACERYARPCRVRELGATQRTVAVLDIGTGLGLNLAAALAALEGTNANLHAVTLERDADVIHSALALADWPAEVERHYAPLRNALAGCLAMRATTARVELGGRGSLTLLLGDATQCLPQFDRSVRFDAVFLDPFAPSVEPGLWEAQFLGEVARRMRDGAVLSTYSASLRVRRALVAGGLSVGRGPRVGLKSAGTLAGIGAHLPPLDARTQRRLARHALAQGSRDGPGAKT